MNDWDATRICARASARGGRVRLRLAGMVTTNRRGWAGLCASVCQLVVAFGCGNSVAAAPPSQLVLTPTSLLIPQQEPQLNWNNVGWSLHYEVEHDGDRPYLMYRNHHERHRTSVAFPAGTSMTLIDVRTAHGVQTYMHATRYSHFLLNYGKVVWSRLFVVRGDKAALLMDTSTRGILQNQGRMPMPGVHIDPSGDLYALAERDDQCDPRRVRDRDDRCDQIAFARRGWSTAHAVHEPCWRPADSLRTETNAVHQPRCERPGLRRKVCRCPSLGVN